MDMPSATLESSTYSSRENSIRSEEVLALAAQLVDAGDELKAQAYQRQQYIETSLANAKQILERDLEEVQETMMNVRSVLRGVGTDNLQAAIDMWQRSGKEGAEALIAVCEETKQGLKEVTVRLEQAIAHMTKNLSKTINLLQPIEYEKFVDEGRESVEAVSRAAMQQMNQVTRWFNWRNLTLAFLISLIVSIATGLYLDDEWPWEMHDVVVKQRKVATAVMDVWPNLTQVDQALILNQTTS